MKTTKKMYFYLLLAVGSILYSCKHDQAEFEMHDYEFTDSVYPEMMYQQQLNLELQNLPSRNEISNFGYKRQKDNKVYLDELMENTTLQNKPPLTDEHLRKILLLRRQTPVDLQYLQSLLIESDQKMIGYHVKASGALGLINANLREWSQTKLKYLTADLNDIQHLIK